MEYIINFIIGGTLFVLIKYLSNNMKDIKYSSMIAAFPIGLISILIILESKRENYSKSYLITCLILTFIAFFNYIFICYCKYSVKYSLLFSIILWILFNIVYIKFI